MAHISPASRLVLSLAAVVALVACGDGGDESDSGADSSPATAVDTAADDQASVETDPAGDGDAAPADTTSDESADTTGDDAGDPAPGGSIDGSDIDWSTVDLTTIDWANLDFSTVDFAGVDSNPTVTDLDLDTIQLIRERYTNEVAAAGGEFGSGMATLTIGDETWTFDDFVCAFGYANTQSDVFSFSSNAFGTLDDGTRTQLQANVWDETGADSLTGPDTDHEITFNDIDDFDDPAVNWLMTGTQLMIVGTEVSVEGATFRDLGTGEERTGSFTGDCGPGSRL